MIPPRAWTTVLLAVLIGGATLSCGSADKVINNETEIPTDPGQMCRDEVNGVNTTINDLGTRFDGVLSAFGGPGATQLFGGVKSDIERIQSAQKARLDGLCEQLDQGKMLASEFERRRACLEDTANGLKELGDKFSNPNELGNATQAVWAMGSNTAWIEQSLDCEQPAVPEPKAKPVDKTGTVQERGVNFKSKGPMTLVPAEGQTIADAPAEVSLKAMLLCQRKQPDGTYVDVPACNRAELTEDDRIKIGFETAGPARVYLLMYNNTGQFQMLFPDVGVDNAVVGGQQYFLPPNDWFELDNVGGVTEYVHVVASPYKVADLEAYRGVNIPPQEASRAQIATRGKLEGIMVRGVKQKAAPVTLDHGAGTASTIPVNVSSLDVAGVELEIIHK